MRTCPKCKSNYEEDEFPVDRSRVSGRYPYCKACAVMMQMLWRENNPDKHKAIVARRLARIKKSHEQSA